MGYPQQTATATAMEAIELYGGHTIRRGPEQADDRWPAAQIDVENALGDILDIFEGLARDTIIEDELPDLIGGFCTSIHFRLQAMIRKQDDALYETMRLQREHDGGEIHDVELQRQTNLLQASSLKVEALETLRDVLAAYVDGRYDLGWQPPRGSHYSQNRMLTSARIEARDFIAAIKARKADARIPEGTRIVFAGHPRINDTTLIIEALDRQLRLNPDMVLVHGGYHRGADAIADQWAKDRGVARIICPPDKADGNRGPFTRNTKMLALDIKGVIAAPGNGPTENLVTQARQRRIPVKRIGIASPDHPAG